MALIWFGNRVKDKLLKATKDAIEETMGECVVKAVHRVPLLTTTLQGSLRFKPAEIKRDEVVGLWGSFDVGYALHIELGGAPVGPTDEDVKKFLKRPGVRRGQGKGQLRRTADEEYPRLKERIERRFQSWS